MVSVLKTLNDFQLFSRCLKQSTIVSVRGRKQNPPPRKRHPEWLPKPTRVLYNEDLTSENKEFLSEVVSSTSEFLSHHKSPLNTDLIPLNTVWTPKSRRSGLIGKKIGVHPMWLKDGKKVLATLIQIIDNQVVKYIPPEEYKPVISKKRYGIKKSGCLVLGAINIDPQLITKEYSGIFNSTGVIPKKVLMRFMITPNAALQPGTPLYATHFKPGEFLDIRAKTVDRGFQGVMKRWGFKGMPASHGVTKTHRRPGNIASGSGKARVMPGTKLPGHMGNRWRILRGVKILRINTKYNVIWVLAQNVPGETNTTCYLFDTILPTKRDTSPHFPTYLPDEKTGELPENLYADDVHQFDNPSIVYQPES